MPAEKRSLHLLNNHVSSHFDPKLRRTDAQQPPPAHAVVEEQLSTSTNNDDRLTPPLPVPHHHQLQQPKLEDTNDPVLQDDSDLDSSQTQDPPEFVYVELQSIRKEVQCPICLGIIKKTRTVMECLHRFCRECIDKSMRMGNNECPACRTHCASRRSLRDDPRYDELIAALYPDIKKYEEEELAFYEEDEVRNKQIQECITQVLIKQSEALGKRRPINKDSAGPSAGRSQRKTQRKKRKRRNGSVEDQDSDDNDETLDIDKKISPNEQHREIKPRKAKTRGSIGISHSPSATNASWGSFDNNVEQSKEEKRLSPGLTSGTKRLSWGRGGVRSNTRHGNINDVMSNNARRMHLAKFVDFLRNLDENDDEFSTPVKDEKLEHMGIQEGKESPESQSMVEASPCSDKQSQVAERIQGCLHKLEIEGTTPRATVASCMSSGEQLALAYREKEAM